MDSFPFPKQFSFQVDHHLSLMPQSFLLFAHSIVHLPFPLRVQTLMALYLDKFSLEVLNFTFHLHYFDILLLFFFFFLCELFSKLPLFLTANSRIFGLLHSHVSIMFALSEANSASPLDSQSLKFMVKLLVSEPKAHSELITWSRCRYIHSDYALIVDDCIRHRQLKAFKGK